MNILQTAKEARNPKELEERVLDALKKNDVYYSDLLLSPEELLGHPQLSDLPFTPMLKSEYPYKDQYTGTLRENQGIKNIIHQEIETMKRLGLLKENVQTGTLAVSHSNTLESSR